MENDYYCAVCDAAIEDDDYHDQADWSFHEKCCPICLEPDDDRWYDVEAGDEEIVLQLINEARTKRGLDEL